MINLNNIRQMMSISIFDLLKRGNPVFSTSCHLEMAIKWLCMAQDNSKDGGVSEGYHLFHGWLPSYPETTGYIIESFFNYFHLTGDDKIKARALRMADWLLSIQNGDGSIPDSYFKKKLVFDTGQVLFGLVRCYEETNEEKYKFAAVKAGDWLVRVQGKDGSWIKYALGDIPHTYYSRVASSLLKLHKITIDEKYREAAIDNVEWCLKQQRENGWFDNASFNIRHHSSPFSHTIAYTFDGIIEAGIYLGEKRYISAIEKALDHLLDQFPQNACIQGSFDCAWRGDTSFSCLTGNAQIAINLFRLYEQNQKQDYLNAALKITGFLKSRHRIRSGDKNVRGAIAGSYPIWGKYIHFTYPNWAVKFFVDAFLLEEKQTEKMGNRI